MKAVLLEDTFLEETAVFCCIELLKLTLTIFLLDYIKGKINKKTTARQGNEGDEREKKDDFCLVIFQMPDGDVQLFFKG